MSFLTPSREKFSLCYALFGLTLLIAILSASGVLRPWSGTLIAFLAMPANVFIQLVGPVRSTGIAGDVLLVVQLALVLGLLLAYSYVLSSAAIAVRNSLQPQARARRR